MKYRQLTKEQLEALHQEFAQFLASQEIDAKEWAKIKSSNPKLVEEELNLFSDMVWEDVLQKTKYLTHTSEKVLNLFKCEEDQITRIVLRYDGDLDFRVKEHLQHILKNLNNDALEIFQGTKKYNQRRNQELFQLIESGAEISDGKLFDHIESII